MPPSSHLSLISTLALHPSFTTRAKTPDLLVSSNLALKYLRLLNKTVGPVNANISSAYAYNSSTASSRRSGGSRRRIGGSESPEKDDSETVHIDLANTEGLWSRANDFWHVVGWAFNCSIAYKKRWERYQLWLNYIIDVLEDDWEVRSDAERSESLIIRYIDLEGLVSSIEKRIVRAIFAEGSARSLAEFPEIWKNESRERKSAGDAPAIKKPTAKISIEEDNYGDYLSSSSSNLDEEDFSAKPEPSPPRSGTTESSIDGALLLGGHEALTLRTRLLALLARVSIANPTHAPPLLTLYDLYLTQIRPLPLPTFSLFLSPPSLSLFTPAAASSLTQYIARTLVESAAPPPPVDDLSQEVMEECYLPFAANTRSVGDNARFSLCVEALVRLYDGFLGLEWRRSLEQAADRGIRAREEKGKRMGGRKGEAGQEGGMGDREVLRASGVRLRAIVAMARAGGKMGKKGAAA